MNDSVKGYAAGILSAITYGMNPLFGIRLYREGLEPPSVLLYRFGTASLLLAVLMLCRRTSFALPVRQIPFAVLLGILLALSSGSWFMSFRSMDSGIGAVVMFVYPVLVALIMAFGYRERLAPLSRLGLWLALGGVAILCAPGEGARVSWSGILFSLFSALTYAVYLVMVKVSRLKELHPETLTFYAMFIGACCFLAVLCAGPGPQKLPSWNALGNVLGLAFFPSFLSFYLVAVAVKCIGPTPSAVLGALEPLTAVVIGITVFGESCSWHLLLGCALVLGSVFSVVCAKPRTPGMNS